MKIQQSENGVCLWTLYFAPLLAMMIGIGIATLLTTCPIDPDHPVLSFVARIFLILVLDLNIVAYGAKAATPVRMWNTEVEGLSANHMLVAALVVLVGACLPSVTSQMLCAAVGFLTLTFIYTWLLHIHVIGLAQIEGWGVRATHPSDTGE